MLLCSFCFVSSCYFDLFRLSRQFVFDCFSICITVESFGKITTLLFWRFCFSTFFCLDISARATAGDRLICRLDRSLDRRPPSLNSCYCSCYCCCCCTGCSAVLRLLLLVMVYTLLVMMLCCCVQRATQSRSGIRHNKVLTGGGRCFSSQFWCSFEGYGRLRRRSPTVTRSVARSVGRSFGRSIATSPLARRRPIDIVDSLGPPLSIARRRSPPLLNTATVILTVKTYSSNSYNSRECLLLLWFVIRGVWGVVLDKVWYKTGAYSPTARVEYLRPRRMQYHIFIITASGMFGIKVWTKMFAVR